MAENSNIEWTDHTFNPVIGCTKVSPACDYCYAEDYANRYFKDEQLWNGNLRLTSDANWRKPLSWNKKCEQQGIRQKVFCASLSDVFDNQWQEEWRDALWELIRKCPHLDWLLLTKRPQNIKKMLPEFWDGIKGRVWLGTTVENQEEANRRLQYILEVDCAKRFVSCEPLLEEVLIDDICWEHSDHYAFGGCGNPLTGDWMAAMGDPWLEQAERIEGSYDRIHWVIAGCESINKRPGRTSDIEWYLSLKKQCTAAGTAFFMKQMVIDGRVTGDISQFPKELQIREFPKARAA